MPLVSVLMPVYNGGRFIAEALQSIITQSFTDFEIIVVDDCSNDDTPRILADFQRRDNRLKITRLPRHLGIVAALNTGLQQCAGKYVARMDADDIALPHRLALQIKYLEEHSHTAALGGSVTYMGENGENLGVIRHSTPHKSLLYANPLLHPTVVFRSSLFKTHRLKYLEKYRYAEDYFFWLQISKIGGIDALEEVVLKYRISSRATRFRRLKGVLSTSLRVKLAGMAMLRIQPTFSDVLRFFAEAALLALPANFTAALYKLFLLLPL